MNRWLIGRGKGHAVVHQYHQPTVGDGQHTAHERQSENLARHLNGQHPGTVLLLARHAPGGRRDATAAELTGADDEALTLTAAVPRGCGRPVPGPAGRA